MTAPTPLRTADRSPGAWWHDAVGYEVYVRSFADSDGDGVGDLAGITSRLDHLVELGVDLIWLTPFYPSPMADFGYDVADYVGVDPRFGTVADLEQLTRGAHARGQRVIIDLVPNHCSSSHPWFLSAVADPTGPHRDHFIWADPAPDGGPPNNWISYFGGSAWTFEPQSGQYYLHLFLPEQPDLNWRSPAVLAAFDEVLETWLGRGVDGFRIDVAQALVKDEHLRDNPVLAPWDPLAPRWEQWEAFEHRYELLQPETLDIFARWRAITARHDAVLVGETYVLDPSEFSGLLDGRGLDVGFWFALMHVTWDASQIEEALRQALDAVADPRRIGWVAASHDEVRPPSRFGGGDLGRARALALSTLLFTVPGVPFIYQGEELGLLEGVLDPDHSLDPVGELSVSRDGCRTPMPWLPGPQFGFSTAERTWLPHGGRTDGDTAAIQAADPASWFHRYRALVELRRAHHELRGGVVEWHERRAGIIAFDRGPLTVVANTADTAVATPRAGTILFSSTDARRDGTHLSTDDTIGAAEAVVIHRDV